MTTRRYPLDRFLALTGWSLNQTQEIAPCNGTEWRLRNEHGVTELIADRLACAAGWHPHEIWPEMLDHAIADLPDRACPECGQTFIPNRPGHRYCERRCQSRAGERRRYQTDPAKRERKLEMMRRYKAECHDYVRAQDRARWRRKRGDAGETQDAGTAPGNDKDIGHQSAADQGRRSPERLRRAPRVSAPSGRSDHEPTQTQGAA